jgi:hypothetical protein
MAERLCGTIYFLVHCCGRIWDPRLMINCVNRPADQLNSFLEVETLYFITRQDIITMLA